MFGGSVVGLSSLRQHQPKTTEPSARAKELQSYLSKYSGEKASDSNKSRKRRKKTGRPQPGGVRIFEEDNTGFCKSSVLEEVDAEDEEAPVVANPEEAERAMRQVQKLQAGGALDSWEEVPTIVGDIPTTDRSASNTAAQDLSPPRRGRQDSPDLSPQRKRRREVSPVAKRRHDSPDLSPARRRRHDSPDASPPRRQRRASSSPAPSPRQAQHNSPDASPPRRKQKGSIDVSQGPSRHDGPDVLHMRMKGNAAQEDLSPPRKRSRGAADAVSDPARPGGPHKPRFMPDGGRAGKVTGTELAAELQAKKQKDAKQFAALDQQLTGHGAETVYRDKQGQRVTLEELKAQQAASKKPVAETPEWGGGMAQKREAEERKQQMQAEAAKPFARRREDVDEHLRHRERFGDPMAHLVKKRPVVEASIVPAAMQKRMKKAGFLIPQEVPVHSWIKRNLGPPGNRYSIKPGRHWDGVDRSTGFEKEMFTIINARKNISQEAHMWSQGDM
ncbi:hypothetical protein ABBQ32_011936 [Trebouxia sp. C0010 RCD-2024]